MKRKLIGIGTAFFAALFLLSGCKLLNWYLDSRQSREEFSRVEALRGTTLSDGISGGADDGAEPPVLGEYLALYEQNSDFAGWIKIEDTRIDYPVMHSPEEPDRYLKHNFEGQYSVYGVPYVQSDCDLLTSDNLIVYGHSMNDGSMFTDLKKYRSADFYREHSIIQFNTRYSRGTYEIVAAFSTTANSGGFAFNAMVNAADEEAFNAYMAACKELTPYEIEAAAEYGDKLLTLATCEYTHSNGRMVVVAKRLTE